MLLVSCLLVLMPAVEYSLFQQSAEMMCWTVDEPKVYKKEWEPGIG